MYDGVVVGGGIVGLFSACAPQERGLKIAIVDDGKAGQASIAAGGILSPLGVHAFTLPLGERREGATSGQSHV